MYKIAQYCLILLCSSLLLVAQTATRQKPAAHKAPDKQTDIDPLALKVLKAVTDPIREAKAYSFRTRGTRENVADNGQIITYFNTSEITVERPDKLRVDFKGRGQDVQLFYNGGQAVLYAPGPKLYATVPAPKTLDGVLDALEKRDVYLPVKNLLESDPYQSLAPDLKTAYVIGKMQMFDLAVHHLAFTEENAEWQLWVTDGQSPRIQRLQVINKALPGRPRVTVEFSDWNLNASVQPDMFSFKKPTAAREIDFLSLPGGDKK
jgi:hypothetical protein